MQAIEGKQHSVSGIFARALIASAKRQSVPLPVELVAQVERHERVPLAKQDALWEAYCRGSNDGELAGVRVGKCLEIGHLDRVGMLLVTFDTLSDAFQALVDYAPLIGDGGDFSWCEHDGQIGLRYEPHYDVRVRERVEAAMAAVVRLGGWATGGALAVTGLDLRRPAPEKAERFARELGVTCRFSQSHNCLWMSRSDLSLPLLQTNAPLREHLLALVERALHDLYQDDLLQKLAERILTYPRWGKERVAESMGVSARHLGRLLTERGVTFKAVRDKLLAERARASLAENLSIQEIALMLGFSDENAFIRAFRRWEGVTPGHYREQTRRVEGA